MNAGEIDQYSEQGKLLQQVVMMKLREFLGPAYNDEVLPLYIVVMLAHGNPEQLVTENLEAFLGAEQAGVFAAWLFEHLQANKQSYVRPPASSQEKVASQPPLANVAAAAPAAAPAESRKPAGKAAAAASQPAPAAADGPSAAVGSHKPPTAAEPAAAAPNGRRRSSGDAQGHSSSPSKQQDGGHERKRSRSRDPPHRQASSRRYEDRGDYRRHDRGPGFREPEHRGSRYGDAEVPERHRRADEGRGYGSAARGGPAESSGRGRDDYRSERDHRRPSGDYFRDERRPRDQHRDDRYEPRDHRDSNPESRRDARPHVGRSISPGDREKRRRDSGRSAEVDRESRKVSRGDRSGSPGGSKREWDKDKAINPQTSRPWGEEDEGGAAPAPSVPNERVQPAMPAADGARPAASERASKRAGVDGLGRAIFASALRQAAPGAEAIVPRDLTASRPRPSVFSRLEPGGAQSNRRNGSVRNPPIPGARRIPITEHDPHGPRALLDDGPELAGDLPLNDYSPFSHPAEPSRPQVRPAQPLRQEIVYDDDDLGDVLTEESEGLLHTRSLTPHKRHTQPDQGNPEELEAMKKRLRSMELAVSMLQKAPSGPSAAAATPQSSTPPHQRSISVQNVHPAATPAVLIAHFSGCGPIKRATVVKNQATGQPLGLAHVEFETQAAALGALSLSGSLLLQQSIIVMPKAAKKGPVKMPPATPFPPRPFRHSYPPTRPFSPRPPFVRGRGRNLTLNNTRGRGRANGVQNPRNLKYVRPQTQQPASTSLGELPAAKTLNGAIISGAVETVQDGAAGSQDAAKVEGVANGDAA
ncbi:hypothetical protein WJX74_001702 [Apatococcus lobatus]|uniref:RRM domain-containing protein n=1 Tax=Apatococcus lobatus TaxID=904363 RepID=A0AAW1RL32_9CHLO